MVSGGGKRLISSMKANVHNSLCTYVVHTEREWKKHQDLEDKDQGIMSNQVYFKSSLECLIFLIVLSQLSAVYH